jgi:hypothetical protein
MLMRVRQVVAADGLTLQPGFGRSPAALPLSLFAAADDRDVREAGGEPREP